MRRASPTPTSARGSSCPSSRATSSITSPTVSSLEPRSSATPPSRGRSSASPSRMRFPRSCRPSGTDQLPWILRANGNSRTTSSRVRRSCSVVSSSCSRTCPTWTPVCCSRTAPVTTSIALRCTCSPWGLKTSFTALRLLAFAVGAIAIGLILLDHEHCEASADAGGGDAHAHHHRRLFY